MTTINVKGLADLQKFLDQLPAKIEGNVIRGALRAGARPILDAAKFAAPAGEPSEKGKKLYKLYIGALRDSIRISGRIDKRNGKITARVIAGRKNKKTGADVFYAHFIEYGTKPHALRKGARRQSGKYQDDKLLHPGIAPRPFMRPALDGQSSAAVVAAGEYIKKRLATKHGLDTADINIEAEA
jgi:HK97 gp10 family phage protein